MKKVLILSAMLVLALSLPTFAAYQVNWTETFDYLQPGNLTGQTTGNVTWGNGFSTLSGLVVNPADTEPAQPISGAHYYKQRANGTTVTNVNNAANLRMGYLENKTYKRGRVDAWMYDYKNGSTNQTDTRFGVHSNVGTNNIGYMATINITDVGSGNVNYWRAQWSYTAFALDGSLPTTSGAGWTFTNPLQAPRVQGWNKVRIEFGYTYPVGGNAPTDLWVKWFINHAPTSELSLSGYDLQLVVNTTAGGRWTNMGSGIAGVFIGSSYGCGVRSAPIDDVVFHGNVIPEPTSLLALGTGLVGLMGLIRRKR